MSFLNTLEKYLKEDFEGTNYDFFPIEFDPSTGASFAATKDDSDLAVISIKMVDGTPLDANDMDYDYADVYADVEMEEGFSDEDKNWLLSKLEALGYVENPVVINGKEIKVTPTEKSDDVESEEELELGPELED